MDAQGKRNSTQENIAYLRLTHPSGQEFSFTNRGASWVSWRYPLLDPLTQSSNQKIDVLLGYDHLESYGRCPAYLGASIGRYANRIAQGKVVFRDESLGEDLTLSFAKNDGDNHLHGGPTGLHQKVWKVVEHVPQVAGDRSARLRMEVESPHGEGGYPGNLRVEVDIELDPAGHIAFTYRAVSDRKTILNLTHHPYFNLGGVDPSDRSQGGDLLRDCLADHRVMIDADRIAEVTEGLIPTGRLMTVTGTPFDFRHLRSPQETIEAQDPQLTRGRGYDHFFVLSTPRETRLGQSLGAPPQAQLVHPQRGLVLDMWTNQPGIQFYTGNWLDGSLCGKGAQRYGRRSGICLEPQNFPDAPHHPQFVSSLLEAGQTYENKVIYRLSQRA